MILKVGLILSWLVFWFIYFLFCLRTPIFIAKRKIDDFNKVILTNATITLIANVILSYFFFPVEGISFEFYKFIISILIGEIFFYHSHRILHHQYFYQYHRKHHLLIKPDSIFAVYCSKTEMIFCNYLPFTIGPMLSQMNQLEIGLWSALICLNTLSGHSSHRFNNKILDFIWGSDNHYLHHIQRDHNYGFLGLCDRLYGTNKSETTLQLDHQIM